MPLNSDEKLKNFASEAMDDAKRISEEIERQTKIEYQEKTKDGRKKIHAQIQNHIEKETEKIRKEKSLEVSQANVKTRQDYFKYADTISSRVFESVEEKLRILCQEYIDNIMLTHKQPLFLEIPDRHGFGRSKTSIIDHIKKSIGLKL